MVNNYAIEEWLRYRFNTESFMALATISNVHTRLTIRNANLYAKIDDDWKEWSNNNKNKFNAQSTDVAHFNY